jgi:hypothetical protein
VKVGNELDSQIREMRAHFLVPASTDEILKELDAARSATRPEYHSVVSAFGHNLASAVSTVAMPFRLATASVEQSHFQRIHIAERIRARYIEEDALHSGEELEAMRDREAHIKAQSRMQEFVGSDDGQDVLIRDTCRFLLASLKHGLELAAHELIHQGLLLIWSAFQVFCRDAFETLLNRDPVKVRILITHPTTRKRFEAERLPLDTLAQYGFDLSARLGTVLVSQQNFSDLRTIKAVFVVLFPGDTALTQALAQRDLWTLYQRRHLIVHRRGVIDQDYLDATGETLEIGTRLVVTPLAFETALSVVVSAGTEVARSLVADQA